MRIKIEGVQLQFTAEQLAALNAIAKETPVCAEKHNYDTGKTEYKPTEKRVSFTAVEAIEVREIPS